MTSRVLALPLVLATFATLPAAAAARIETGRSIGGVRLGMSEQEAIEVRGTPTSARTIPDEIRGQVREVRWSGGLRAIFGTNSGATFVVTTSRAERVNGVGVGSTERALRRAVKGVRCSSAFGRRRCTRGQLVPGGKVTDFAIGPKTRRVRSVSVGIVID